MKILSLGMTVISLSSACERHTGRVRGSGGEGVQSKGHDAHLWQNYR